MKPTFIKVFTKSKRLQLIYGPQHNTLYTRYGDCVMCVDKVLDELGIGPSGPPIPPPVTLAVLPYPVERLAEASLDTCHVCFVPLPEEM